MTDFFQVGAVTSTHGIRGEVKVYPTTDDVKRFRKLKEVIVRQKNGAEETLTVESARFFRNMVILKFKGIDDINDVEKYKGSELLVTRENAVALGENEYFIADLIGLAVYEKEELLGELTDVLSTGANDVYEVSTPFGEKILVPAIRDCVKSVDVNAGRMDVELLPGLRELYASGKKRDE